MLLFGFVVGGPFWGWASDRIRRRKSPLIFGLVVGGTALTIALYVPGIAIELYYLLLFFCGFGSAAMVVAYALTREHNATRGTGAALGLVNMAAVAGGAVFQPVIGLLLDLQWDGVLAGGARIYAVSAYKTAFITLPALFVLALCCAVFVRETRCRPVVGRIRRRHCLKAFARPVQPTPYNTLKTKNDFHINSCSINWNNSNL